MTAITVIAILAAAATIYGFVAMDSCERIKVAPKGKREEIPGTGGSGDGYSFYGDHGGRIDRSLYCGSKIFWQ